MLSFVFSANQKPFVICTRVTRFALVLHVCTRVTEELHSFSANQNWEFFCVYIIIKKKHHTTRKKEEEEKKEQRMDLHDDIRGRSPIQFLIATDRT